MIRARRLKLICKIDAAGFASIMIVLAVVMIFSAALTPPHNGISTDLPKVNHPKPISRALREDAMIVVIMRNGDVFFRTDRIAPDQLARLIREQLDHGSERKVYIRADKRVYYRSVKDVLGGVRAAGLENVSFFVERGRITFPH